MSAGRPSEWDRRTERRRGRHPGAARFHPEGYQIFEPGQTRASTHCFPHLDRSSPFADGGTYFNPSVEAFISVSLTGREG